jgi:adenylate cyclase class IV
MFFLDFFKPGKKKESDTGELEAEVKILHVTESQVDTKLAAVGAKKVFAGKVVTTWFKKSLLERVNARVRTTIDEKSNQKFEWTVKSVPESDGGSDLFKNKLKRTGNASSLKDAKKGILKELKRMGVVVAPSFLTSKLTVEKRRASYICESGACAGLRLDFDTITAVDGEPLEPELAIMEIEDISNRPAKEKEEKIKACAASLGIVIDENFSSLSTRKLLKKLGYR